MWNTLRTDEYEGMIAETTVISGARGELINAYFSRPIGQGPYPGIVLIPHMPGWDEFYRETARRFTQHGYQVMCPDIYSRFGKGTPTEVAGAAREKGGAVDRDVVDDCAGALAALKANPSGSGRVGVIGTCSGGRHAFLAACSAAGFSAAVDCWGGGVSQSKDELTPARPVAPIDLTKDLACPLLGIFGNDDQHPSPSEVDALEAALKENGKDYEFHRYDGCGHGFWYYHTPMYRPEAAMDSWEKVLEFFGKHLK